MTEQEAINFCKNNPESAAKIIMMVDKLEQRIKELESRLNMNSSNSSKPPSTDDEVPLEGINSQKIKANPPQNQRRNEGHRVDIKVKI